MIDDNVTKLDDRRKASHGVWLVTMPPPAEQPKGPFTVTISNEDGKMFEVVFPDYLGNLPPDAFILGTAGYGDGLLVNLLSGALRVFAGAR